MYANAIMPVMTAADASNADLKRRCRVLVVMIARQMGVAGVLVLFRERSQFLAAVLFRRIRFVPRHRLHPVVGLLEQGRLPCFVGNGAGLDRDRLGGGAERGLSDCLGLEEIPGIGCPDVERNAFGLRTLAQGFGERQEKRKHRDQQRDLLVQALYQRFFPAAAMPVLLMLDVMLDFMLDRVHAMTHVALRASSETMYRTWSLSQGGGKGVAREGHADAACVTPLSRRQIPSIEQAALAQQLEERVLGLRQHGLHAR
jgi:hypothetical protein